MYNTMMELKFWSKAKINRFDRNFILSLLNQISYKQLSDKQIACFEKIKNKYPKIQDFYTTNCKY